MGRYVEVGLNKQDAELQAAVHRLRPILSKFIYYVP
jgi:hypothetical protein